MVALYVVFGLALVAVFFSLGADIERAGAKLTAAIIDRQKYENLKADNIVLTLDKRAAIERGDALAKQIGSLNSANQYLRGEADSRKPASPEIFSLLKAAERTLSDLQTDSAIPVSSRRVIRAYFGSQSRGEIVSRARQAGVWD